MVTRHHAILSDIFRREACEGVATFSFIHHLRALPVLFAVAVVLATVYLYRARVAIRKTMANTPAEANGKPPDASQEFQGDVKVNNKPPSKEQLEKVANIPVLDVHKKSHTFKSLYADNENGARRVLVVFIRHFFCGNCQEYLRTLAASIPPSSLATLSPQTSIIVIGCGSPDLLPMYIRETSCPYPIYADPTRRVYDLLGMTKSLSLGSQAPAYMQRSLLSVAVQSFFQELRSGRKLFSGGDYRQVGGEFLFENGKVSWCSRMKNTRDHAELPEIRKQLGVDNDSETPRARKRWSTAGLGAELGRKLSISSRRRSWGGSRSRSRNTEKKQSSPARSGMQEVKEEESASATATPEDALAKLEGKVAPIAEVKGSTPIDKPTDGLPDGRASNGLSTGESTGGLPNGVAKEEEEVATGSSTGAANEDAAIYPKADRNADDVTQNTKSLVGLTNGTMNGSATEGQVINRSADGLIHDTKAVNGLTNGRANGHVVA